MRTSSVTLLIATAIASGCGGEATERTPQDIDSSTAQPSAASPTDPMATVPAGPPQEGRPLSATERRRLTMISRSVDNAIDLFDKTVRACPKLTREACMDRAWAVIVVDLDWPPYYLRRFDARTRGCEPLAYAVKGVNGFNLAARQIDFGDPAEYGTPTRRRDYLALVDGLRPVPTDMRDAASRCR